MVSRKLSQQVTPCTLHFDLCQSSAKLIKMSAFWRPIDFSALEQQQSNQNSEDNPQDSPIIISHASTSSRSSLKSGNNMYTIFTTMSSGQFTNVQSNTFLSTLFIQINKLLHKIPFFLSSASLNYNYNPD